MAYEIVIEGLELRNHPMTVDCTVEIDDGGPGDWAIESISIPSYNGDEDLFLTRKDAMFRLIADTIMRHDTWSAHIDEEAKENNTPSLTHKPSWY
jgi:hypothetical protein